MNKITTLFREKQCGILSVYFTAGFPDPNNTPRVIRTLAAANVDMIEIGIPFSDPLADGIVIQQSSATALRDGMTLKRLFEQLTANPLPPVPLVLMGYLTPIMQHGFENFCRSCVHAGVSGMIIPDLPFKDYLRDYKPVADRHDLKIIMLVTPETSPERVRLIDENTDGFIYVVSSSSITGARNRFSDETIAYFRRLADMKLRNPLLIGFGISNKATFSAANAHAAGAIIGSKFVSLLSTYSTPTRAVERLIDALNS